MFGQYFIISRKTLLDNPFIQAHIKAGLLPRDLDFGKSTTSRIKDGTEVFIQGFNHDGFALINRQGEIINREGVLKKIEQKDIDISEPANWVKILGLIGQEMGENLEVVKNMAKKHLQGLYSPFKTMISSELACGKADQEGGFFSGVIPRFRYRVVYYVDEHNGKIKLTASTTYADGDKSEKAYIETFLEYKKETESFVIEFVKTNDPLFLKLLGIKYIEKKEESKGNRHEEKERDLRKRLPIVSCRGQQESGSDEYVSGTFWSMKI